jgi:hypothetical protein
MTVSNRTSDLSVIGPDRLRPLRSYALTCHKSGHTSILADGQPRACAITPCRRHPGKARFCRRLIAALGDLAESRTVTRHTGQAQLARQKAGRHRSRSVRSSGQSADRSLSASYGVTGEDRAGDTVRRDHQPRHSQPDPVARASGESGPGLKMPGPVPRNTRIAAGGNSRRFCLECEGVYWTGPDSCFICGAEGKLVSVHQQLRGRRC